MNKVNYNPDVLTCLANLSNDEVFTPPVVVNQMLDLLPESIWADKNATFLDPVCKSGVFLREIAKRLLKGLENEIPDLQDRINHIFTKQLYGIAITELTSLLSRRSVYCSKLANGKYSVSEAFDKPEGNIVFNRIEHSWKNGKCEFCGASQEVYDRDNTLETHAYQFIHTRTPEELFNMRFDVIVGNPPYQLSDGGFDKSASPIYHMFIEQAIKLNPRYLSMIVPARWYSGGKGLDEFRSKMLNDKRISQIHDFPETADCFPGLNIRGGVCYFLWEKEHSGDCKITNYKNGSTNSDYRPLLEKGNEYFIRYNEAMSIVKKVQSLKESSFASLVSSRKPFGLPTNFSSFKKNKSEKANVLLYRFGENGYVEREKVDSNLNWVDQYKVLVPKASPGGDYYPHQVLGWPIVAPPKSCCTETYIVINPCSSEEEANNVASYLRTKLVRFLILLIKNTQDVPKKVYTFVPIQDFSRPWNDIEIYNKYGITDKEREFIDLMVRPMELNSIENLAEDIAEDESDD